MTRLVLMCGLPGAGKTTRARDLATRLAAVRFTPDEWLTELGLDVFDEEQRDRLEKLLWRHAQDLLRHGRSVILDYGFWSRAERAEKRDAARALGVRVQLDYVDVPFTELARRVADRNGRGLLTITPEQLTRYAAFFEAPDGAELATYDG